MSALQPQTPRQNAQTDSWIGLAAACPAWNGRHGQGGRKSAFEQEVLGV